MKETCELNIQAEIQQVLPAPYHIPSQYQSQDTSQAQTRIFSNELIKGHKQV